MANTKSAMKEMRRAERRRQRNRPIQTGMRTALKRARAAVDGTAPPEETQALVLQAISSLDRAARKGVVHPNSAARRKSRLVRRLNAQQTVGSGQ